MNMRADRRKRSHGRGIRPGLGVMASALGIAVWLVAGDPLGAQEEDERDPEATRERLERLERELTERERHHNELARQAEEAGRAAEALARQILAATARVQALEEQVAGLQQRISDLNAMLERNEALLATRREQMARTLAALQRLARRPADLALLYPDDAEATLKSAILLRELVPQLESEAAAIGKTVERIIALRSDLADEQAALADQRLALERDRASLRGLLERRKAERKRLLSEAEEEASRVTELAQEAESLEELLAALDEERQRRQHAAREAAERLGRKPSPEAGEPDEESAFAAARGSMPLPARGRLVSGFGQASDVVRKKGIVIATLEGAQVVAPYDGRVAFAGRFGGYGRLLIIAHSGGYHTLLAGMERIYASVGQWVLAGEPVGVMDGEDREQDSPSLSNPDAPRLYVELRRHGSPVDPLPWLAAGLGKVG